MATKREGAPRGDAHEGRPRGSLCCGPSPALLCLVVLCCIWTPSAVEAEQQPQLNQEELQQVFGRSDDFPDHQLVWPRLSHSGRHGRSVSQFGAGHLLQQRPLSHGPNQPLHLSLDALGETYSFRLLESIGLVSESAALVHRYRNYTKVESLVEKRPCLYTGVQNTTTIAINICTSMRGVIRSPTEELIIEPLPPSALRRYQHRRRRGTRQLEADIPLLVHRRRDSPPCSVAQESGDREYLLSRYHPSSSPISGSSSLFGRGPQRSPDGGGGLSNSADHDLFLSADNRNKLPSIVYVETAVFVDKDLARHMEGHFPHDAEEQLVQIVLAMVNAVQLLYSDGSLGLEVHFVLKRLEILHEDPTGLHRPHDIDMFLTSFCRWQRDENPSGDDHAQHWDHALVLTGLDLYTVTTRGRLNSQVVGLAPVAGMCSASSSCTVNEGRHFETVFVVAHEIGHNLGMRHDGTTAGNSCDPGEHLMSPTLGSGKISWSSCSRRYLEIFLSSEQSSCLRDSAEAEPGLDHRRPALLPGQRFPADMQCMLKHGPGSTHAETQPLDEICEDLHCRRDHYTWTSHPALEGTACGQSRWCTRGRCAKQAISSGQGVAFSPHKTPTRGQRPNSFFDNRRGEQQVSVSVTGAGPHTPLGPNSLGPITPTVSSPIRVLPGPGLTSILPVTFTIAPDVYRPQASVPAPLSPQDGWGECQSSCLYGVDGVLSSGSIGLQASSRACSTCRGQLRYRTCSAVHQCAVGGRRTLQDFADQACRALRGDQPHYSGLASPIPVQGLAQCRVSCEQLSLAPSVSGTRYPDGTACHLGTGGPAYCVTGECRSFSCDAESQFVASGPHCRPLKAGGPINGLEQHFWGPWLQGSSCRTSCITNSRGIELVSRQCLRRDSDCPGLSKNIRLCFPDTQGCHQRQEVFQYATEVCRRFQRDVSQLSGVGMQLNNTPTDPDRACTVACQDLTLHYRFYRVNGREGWFPFGTDCSGDERGASKHCLNGKCLDFDHDGIPFQEGNLESGPRSRSLKLDPEADDLVEIQPLLPLHGLSRRSTAPPLYSHHQQELMMHRQLINQHLQQQQWALPHPEDGTRFKRVVRKRDVTVTSHRVPGSIDSDFLMTLVDQLNYTITHENDTQGTFGPSTIDLDNPIFADIDLAARNSSHEKTIHTWSTHSHRHNSTGPHEKVYTIIDAINDLAKSRASDNEHQTEEPLPLEENSNDYTQKILEPVHSNGSIAVDRAVAAQQEEGTPEKFPPPGPSLGTNRGRSLYPLPDTNRLAEQIGPDVEEGVWQVKKTPCSVTCGQGLMEVLVICVPAASARPSDSRWDLPSHSPAQKTASAWHGGTTSRAIYLHQRPLPDALGAKFSYDGSPPALDDPDRWSPLTSRTLFQGRYQPLKGLEQTQPTLSTARDKVFRNYFITIGDRSKRPILRNETLFSNLDNPRESQFSDPDRRVTQKNKELLPSPSFTSNSQLRKFVYHKRGKSIDSRSSRSLLATPKVKCAEPLPTRRGFQQCIMRPCQEEVEPQPSSAIAAWLTSLISDTQQQ